MARLHLARWHADSPTVVMPDIGHRPCACGARLPWFTGWPHPPAQNGMCPKCVERSLLDERRAGRTSGRVDAYHFAVLCEVLGEDREANRIIEWDPGDGWPAMRIRDDSADDWRDNNPHAVRLVMQP